MDLFYITFPKELSDFSIIFLIFSSMFTSFISAAFGIGGGAVFLGLLGIFDVATSLGYKKQKEDLGQTLAVYGVDPGPYLVLPLLGPSTVRDAIGKVTGFIADPVTIALNQDGKENWIWIGTAVNGIDFREQNLEKIDNLEATSVDFYATIRSLYLERRNRMIRNQSADEQDPFQEFDIE